MENSEQEVAQETEASIEKRLLEAALHAVIKALKNDGILVPNYSRRMEIPQDIIERIYNQIDYNKVVAIMGAQINEMVATKITATMTTEITSDVKSVLSHGPTRERLRTVVAAEIEKIKVGN
jgi:hypothetical protein